MTTSDTKTVGNGPEWVLSAGGDRIAYSKFVAGMPHARVAMAHEDSP